MREIRNNHTTDIKSDGGYPLITIGRFCIMSFLSNESPKKIFGGFQILISWAQLPYKLTKLNRTNQDHMFYILQIETFHLVWAFGRGYRLYFHQNLNQFILIFVNFKIHFMPSTEISHKWTQLKWSYSWDRFHKQPTKASTTRPHFLCYFNLWIGFLLKFTAGVTIDISEGLLTWV